MKKIICKVEYDTDNAEFIAKYTCGDYGDPKGYEETLFKTPTGKFFLYTVGGAESEYEKESITRLSPQKAEEWRKERGV